MKTAIIHLSLALLAGSVAAAREPKEPRGHRPPPPIIVALDTDRDGTISAAEIENAPNALRHLDKNNDGALTRDELRPQGPPPPEESRPPGPPPGGEPGEPMETE